MMLCGSIYADRIIVEIFAVKLLKKRDGLEFYNSRFSSIKSV